MKPDVNHAFKSLAEARQELRVLKSYWSGESILETRLVLFIAERLEAIERLLAPKPKTKRKLSEWQRYFAAGMRAGSNPAEIARLWKRQR